MRRVAMGPDADSPGGDEPSNVGIGHVEIEMMAGGPFRAVVVLRGEHDLATAPAVAAALASIDGKLLVDLSACDFIDSTVIGVIVGAARDMDRPEASLEVVVPPEALIARTLEIVRVGDIIPVHPSRAAVLGTPAESMPDGG